MSLYIANCTKQIWNCNVRLPENIDKVLVIPINSGQQVEIGKNWSKAQKDLVVENLQKFGLRHRSQINTRLSDCSGYLYDEKPITEEVISNAHESVVENQEKRSAAEASKAALGAERATRDPRTKKRLAKEVQVEVIQDVPAREKRTGKEVNMSITVAEGGSTNEKALPI